MAVCLSILVHVVAFLALNPWPRGGMAGAPGPALGSGMNLVMVSEASLGLAARHPPPMNAEVTTTPQSPPSALAAAEQVEGGQAKMAPATSDTPHTAPAADAPQTVAWRRDGDARLDASEDREQRGARDAAGGDPAAASEILSQIARCLPAGLRPNLPAQRLVLKVSANGTLAAAPIVDSVVPILTAADRAIADRVVQAALQCGPYTKAELLGQVVSVAVDFSEVRTAAGPLLATH